MSTSIETQSRTSTGTGAASVDDVHSETPARTSSTAANIDSVHPSAVGANTQPDATKTLPNNETPSTNKPSVEGDSTYPEQKHAGAVGYGPNYNPHAGLGDKITGLKEQVKGKISHNPDLVAQGHERVTGDLKKKELQGDNDPDPFADPEDKKKQAEGQAGTPSTTAATGTPAATANTNAAPNTTNTNEATNAAPNTTAAATTSV